METRQDTTDRKQNDTGDFNAAFDAIYRDLKKRASRLRRVNPSVTMLTTEIVNQTYVNLRPARALKWNEVPHFKSIVVLAMRRLMVDLARKREAEKRGGRDVVRVPVEEVDVADDRTESEYVLDLNRALNELAEIDARQANILELKYFGGLSNVEITQELGISESTVLRDLRAAEAWLRVRLPQSVVRK